MIFMTESLPTEVMMETINVILIDLDTMVGETICKNADDSFTVFINSRWSSEMQRRCFCHALDHIRNNDWEKDDADSIEGARHDTNGDLLSSFDRSTS